jgi:SAM-dependent methyltransferase
MMASNGVQVIRLVIVGSVATAGCSSPGHHAHGQANHAAHGDHAAHAHGHGFTDAAAWAKVFDDPARDAWQRPDDVIRAMELTPTMTVADIGAGTGYFAVRLARLVPTGRVIATDIEADMVKHLTERAAHDKIDNLQAVMATESSAGLGPDSVDRILIVDVWHHLGDRVSYARELGAALRPGGRLFIVDYSATATRGPPAQMRLAPEAVIAELVSAGWSASLSPTTLPEQYIIEARRN